jgi:DNA-binding transcriptional regulator YdaS (Cro superfamily)
MQTLNEYLMGRKKAEFAKQIGVSASQLSQYLSRYRRPGYEQMLAIEAATGGAVPVQSWAHDASTANAPAHIQAPLSKSTGAA